MSNPSRILTDADAALVKALIAAGWMQSDVASLLQCNLGRISEVNTGFKFADVAAANLSDPAIIASIQQIQTAWSLRVNGLISQTVKVAA